jgi:hypothetical protein
VPGAIEQARGLQQRLCNTVVDAWYVLVVVWALRRHDRAIVLPHACCPRTSRRRRMAPESRSLVPDEVHLRTLARSELRREPELTPVPHGG